MAGRQRKGQKRRLKRIWEKRKPVIMKKQSEVCEREGERKGRKTEVKKRKKIAEKTANAKKEEEKKREQSLKN